MSLSYESSGVRYDQLDAFKRACQEAARTTASQLTAHGYAEPATTRGESAYLIEAVDHYLAHVEEGLGTKNLVADAVYAGDGQMFLQRDRHRYGRTIVNDLITCGARPISVAMHAAWAIPAGSPTLRACTRWSTAGRGAATGGRGLGRRRNPTLKGIVDNSAIVLAARPSQDLAQGPPQSPATSGTATPSSSSPQRACRPTD